MTKEYCDTHDTHCQRFATMKEITDDHKMRLRSLEHLTTKMVGMGIIIMIEIPIALAVARMFK